MLADDIRNALQCACLAVVGFAKATALASPINLSCVLVAFNVAIAFKFRPPMKGHLTTSEGPCFGGCQAKRNHAVKPMVDSVLLSVFHIGTVFSVYCGVNLSRELICDKFYLRLFRGYDSRLKIHHPASTTPLTQTVNATTVTAIQVARSWRDSWNSTDESGHCLTRTHAIGQISGNSPVKDSTVRPLEMIKMVVITPRYEALPKGTGDFPGNPPVT
jgi:hypothetical protein